MRILGVDPGYAIVGFGVLEYTGTTFTLITYGAITTAAETPFLRRLESIYRDFRTLIQQYHPDCVAMERLYYFRHSYFFVRFKLAVAGLK